jgi:hypothetical protein
VRDDFLATTEAGRDWIALVEGRLVGILLADERLSGEAAALLERAAGLVEDESSVVTDDDVERGRLLIRELAERADHDDVRADLEAVNSGVGVPVLRQTTRHCRTAYTPINFCTAVGRRDRCVATAPKNGRNPRRSAVSSPGRLSAAVLLR